MIEYVLTAVFIAFAAVEIIQVLLIRRVIADISARLDAAFPKGFTLGDALANGISGLLQRLDGNPEEAEKVLQFMQIAGVAVGDAALQHILKATKGMVPGGAGIDPGQAQMAIPFLPKKYQGIAQLLLPMLSGGGGGGAQPGQSQRRGNVGYG